MDALAVGTSSGALDVFMLFAIPVGGGIPAGVLVAQAKGFGWLSMTLIYLLSDIALAFLFEPMMQLFIKASYKIKFLALLRDNLKKTTEKTIAGFGAKPGPIVLITIAFGVDPMTGRAAALAAGHSFLSGWTIAIIGDMLFFGVVAISTIKLNNILGDGTWTAIIIMVLMMGIPALIRRFKKVKNK